MISLFFNLLVNSIFSLACGLSVVYFFIWLFRIETGSWKLSLLALPFVKIVYDFARGLPQGSILLNQLDPFTLPPHHQLLQVGLGFSNWGPSLKVIFSVLGPEQKYYAASVGDYFAIWLMRTFDSRIPLIILTIILSISATLFILRLTSAFKFELQRRRDRKSADSLQQIKLRFRKVDVYKSALFSGTPFTGGIFYPYICLPENTYKLLSESEMSTVIFHELAHIRHFDLVINFAIKLLGDLFWFIPGYRWLSRRIDRLREVVADQNAVSSGADPLQLAAALLKLKDTPLSPESPILYSAFFREKSLLRTRVERLIGQSSEKKSRLGWKYLPLRILLTVWILTAVLLGTLGGNQAYIQFKNPTWFSALLQKLESH